MINHIFILNMYGNYQENHIKLLTLRRYRHQKDKKGLCQAFYIHKFGNLDEMGRFLKKHELQLTQYEIGNFYSSMTIKSLNL